MDTILTDIYLRSQMYTDVKACITKRYTLFQNKPFTLT